MPTRPRPPCPFPRCPELAPCPVHAQQREAAYDAARGPAHLRGYDSAWRKLSAAYARAYPRCEEPGCPLPTHEVHHRIPVAVAPQLRLEWSNLVALCASHHRLAESALRKARATARPSRGGGGLGSFPPGPAATSCQSITSERREKVSDTEKVSARADSTCSPEVNAVRGSA